jgi:hypothetical protein
MKPMGIYRVRIMSAPSPTPGSNAAYNDQANTCDNHERKSLILSSLIIMTGYHSR